MFDNDDQNNRPVPTLGGTPMNGISALADGAQTPGSPAVNPVTRSGSVSTPAIVSPIQSTSPITATTGEEDYLTTIKQQALAQLSPLVDKLDQSPEEKFRLTMTMIQASDDHTLIKTAFESAEKIVDEKVRAEALLSIVNEVNYFTQRTSPSMHQPKPDVETSAL